MSATSFAAPREFPGLKRQGAAAGPASVSDGLAPYAGEPIGPAQPLKVPKLAVGYHKPNRQSNVTIPVARTSPLQMISERSGRLAPGDLLWLHKNPIGFASHRGSGGPGELQGPDRAVRVMGTDGLNRLLVGTAALGGWVAGDNVFQPGDGETAASVCAPGGGFRLAVLDKYRLDGVILSNDERQATGNDRDSVVVNVVCQGPCLTNNGLLKHDGVPPETKSLRSGQPIGAQDRLPQRHVNGELTDLSTENTVDAYAKGSIESGQHLHGAYVSIINQPVMNSPWLSSKTFDYLSIFTGAVTQFPAQMFDRKVRSMDRLFVGLRAIELTAAQRARVTESARPRAPGERPFDKDKPAYYYQYMPFSSHTAWLLQTVHTKAIALYAARERAASNDGPMGTANFVARADAEGARAREDAIRAVTRELVPHTRSEPRGMFDNSTFDAIRTDDAAHLVGAYTVGRVLDAKAMKYEQYAGGPCDTAHACTVDVGIAWRPSLYKKSLPTAAVAMKPPLAGTLGNLFGAAFLGPPPAIAADARRESGSGTATISAPAITTTTTPVTRAPDPGNPTLHEAVSTVVTRALEEPAPHKPTPPASQPVPKPVERPPPKSRRAPGFIRSASHGLMTAAAPAVPIAARSTAVPALPPPPGPPTAVSLASAAAGPSAPPRPRDVPEPNSVGDVFAQLLPGGSASSSKKKRK